MSPFHSIRSLLFGGTSPTSAGGAASQTEGQQQQSQQAMEEKKNAEQDERAATATSVVGPHHHHRHHQPALPNVQPRRLAQGFLSTEPAEPMLGSIPKVDRIAYDAAEYYCYVVLHMTSRDALIAVTEELERCMSSLGPIHKYGRLTSRIFITALCQDVCVCSATAHDDNDIIVSLLDVSAQKWTDFKERLVLIRRILLSNSADTFVFPGEDARKIPPNNSDVDPSKEQLPMFGEYYQDLLQKFLVHGAIARFRERLSKIEPLEVEHGEILKAIEAAVDEYKETLTHDVFKDDEIPPSLTSFLLQDLYKSNRKDIAMLPVKLRDDVEKIILDEPQSYSFRSLQVELRSLMKRWHSTLTTPELVRLGYGGLREVFVEDDNRSVSSWGAEEPLNDCKQPHFDTQKTNHDRIESDNEDNAAVHSAATSIEPIPHDSFDEDALPNFPPQHVEQLTNADANQGDEAEPLLQRERDIIHRDNEQKDGMDLAPVTPLRSVVNRKRKGFVNNGDSLFGRSPPLRLEGFSSSSEDELEEERPRKYKLRYVRSPSRSRKFFTEEETDAIREGVKRFGPGNWATIKSNSDGRLDNRTTVQIKDKYRTMVQRGEL